ncbi:unnamed protein product [Rhodiola kirilowii]
MTILSWNLRGMGNPRTIRELRSLIRATNPQVIGLIETKADKKKMERIRVLLGFFGCFVVPAKGASGGLALLWRREVDVSIVSFSFYHIDFLFSDRIISRFTLFYSMKLFQKVVTDCSLFDLGFRGGKYTYSDRRKGARECKSRLDRVLVSQGWLHEYPEAINTHMFTYSSD